MTRGWRRLKFAHPSNRRNMKQVFWHVMNRLQMQVVLLLLTGSICHCYNHNNEVYQLRKSIEDNVYFEITYPQSITYTFKSRYARNFGTSFQQPLEQIRLVPTDPTECCSRLQNAHEVDGGIALVMRGGCSFMSKTIQAEQSGAIALIIADNNIENDLMFLDMISDETKREANIPAVFLLGKDGHKIREELKKEGLSWATINIPINVTNVPLHQLNFAPWNLV